MNIYFDTEKRKVITCSKEIVESERFVKLNQEQEQYFNNHRRASYDAIWYCGNIPRPPRTLNDAIREKLCEIDFYDTSDEVNGFYLNGNLVWLDRDTRASLRNTIESSIILGREKLNIWFNDMYVTLPVATAKNLLAALELYATDCYNVTAQHQVAVKEITTIEEVDNYDITSGYPEKLNFDINE
jgi:hypothetical protein